MPDIISNLGIKNLDGTYDTREIAVNYNNVENLSTVMPLPKDSDREKFLKGDGTWSKVGKDVNYGICHSGSSATNKVAVTADGDYTLEEGSFINIKFDYANAAVNPTLNIDNTGDIDIKAYGDTAPVIWWDDDEIVSFTYDGTNFIMSTTEEQINVLKADKQDNTDNNLSTDNKTIVGAINEVNAGLSNKQNSTDNTLATTSKTVIGAINEINTNLTSSDNLVFNFTKSGTKYGYEDLNGNFVPFKMVQASKTVTAGTSAQTVTPDSGYDGIASITVNPTPSQTKSITATTSAQTVEPDSGNLLSSVTVNPTPSETKTQAAGTSNIDVTPTSGKLLSKVTVTPTPSQTKSASPSTSAQIITPDSGNLLSSVSIGAISPQRTAGTAATWTGIDSTSPYVYFPYGWWPSVNNAECFTRLTAAQAVAACPSQTKSVTATTSAQTVSPDSGKLLSSVTVNAQSHTGYYPSSTTYVTSNGTKDLGANHNYRYVRVSINQTPSSTKVLDWTQTNSEITYKDISLSGYSSYTVIVVTRYGSGGVSLSNRSGCTVSTLHSGAVVNGDSNSSFIGIYRVTGSGTVRAQGGYVSDVYVIGHSC